MSDPELRERVAALETNMEHAATKADINRLESRLEHLATKEDVQRVRVWMLSTALGAVVAGLSAIAALLIALTRVIGQS